MHKKNVHIERIENRQIIPEGQGDTQFSVNTNMQIWCTEISYNQSRKIRYLGQHICLLNFFEGQNSSCEYYFVLGINRALLSIIKLFFHVSSPSGKGWRINIFTTQKYLLYIIYLYLSISSISISRYHIFSPPCNILY